VKCAVWEHGPGWVVPHDNGGAVSALAADVSTKGEPAAANAASAMALVFHLFMIILSPSWSCPPAVIAATWS
jgi:hypothetical protein